MVNRLRSSPGTYDHIAADLAFAVELLASSAIAQTMSAQEATVLHVRHVHVARCGDGRRETDHRVTSLAGQTREHINAQRQELRAQVSLEVGPRGHIQGIFVLLDDEPIPGETIYAQACRDWSGVVGPGDRYQRTSGSWRALLCQLP